MKKKILSSGIVLLSICALAGCGKKSATEDVFATTAVSSEKKENADIVASSEGIEEETKAVAENADEGWTLTADGKYKFRTIYRFTQEEATRRFEADQKLLDTIISVDGYEFNLLTEKPADLQLHLTDSDYVKMGKEITNLSIDLTEHNVTFDGLDVNDHDNAKSILDYCKENKGVTTTNPMGPFYVYGKDVIIGISSKEFSVKYSRARGEYVDGFNLAYDNQYTFNLVDLEIGNLTVLEHLDTDNILTNGLDGTNSDFAMCLSEDAAKKLAIYKSEEDKTQYSISDLCAMTDDEFAAFADAMGFTVANGKDSSARYAYKQDQDYEYQFSVKKLAETTSDGFSYYTEWIVASVKDSDTFARHGNEPEVGYTIKPVE